MATPSPELNGVIYRKPARPVAVACVDGGDPAYFEAAKAAGVIPSWPMRPAGRTRAMLRFRSYCLSV